MGQSIKTTCQVGSLHPCIDPWPFQREDLVLGEMDSICT